MFLIKRVFFLRYMLKQIGAKGFISEIYMKKKIGAKGFISDIYKRKWGQRGFMCSSGAV